MLTARVPRLSLTLVHGSLRLTTLAQREPVLSVSVASPFHRHSLSTPLATLTAVTRVTKERRKHDGVREEPSKPWAGENGTVKETTIPYLSHPHHMVTARDERNEQGPHVMGSGLMFPVPYAPGLTSGSTGFVDDREGNSINLLSSVGSSWSLRKLGSWTFNPYSFSEMGSASRSTSHGNWRVWQGHNHHVTDKRIMYGLQPSWVRRSERTHHILTASLWLVPHLHSAVSKDMMSSLWSLRLSLVPVGLGSFFLYHLRNRA